MRCIGYLGRLGSALLLSAFFLTSAPAAAQDNLLEIYNDPVEFERLSNAAQNLLIARFGPRPRFDEKGNPIPATMDPGRRKARRSAPLLPNGGVVDVLGNVLVNNAAGDVTAQDTQSETALVLGAGSNLICGFNDSGSFLGTNSFTGWAYSSDSGATWTDPGILPGANDAGDPVLARNATTNRIYFSTLKFSFDGINVFRSDNEGVTWQAAVNGTPGSTGFMDKEWIAVDNAPGAGNGNVYLVTREFGGGEGIFLWRSTDHGATWGPNAGTLIATGAFGNVQGAYVIVGTNHHVHALWYDSSVIPAEIRIRTSVDLGLSFGPPVTVTTLVSSQVNGNLTLVAGFRSNSFPQAWINTVSGNIYVVYNDPTVTVGGDRGNILLRQSVDDGATWSTPILVNDDGTTRAQYFPAIAVRPDGSGMAVGWYDNRSHAGDVNIERWGAIATISGSTITFGPNFRISPQFPPVFGVDPAVNFVYMGDYNQMAADNTAYFTTWGDNRDNSIAVPGRKNANVRFTSFGPEGPQEFLDFDSMTVNGGNGNGRIELNECNELVVTVRNNGAAPATGIASILSTTTPEVLILDPAQPYADLPAGEAGSATFQISTSPAFACGTTIHFSLAVTHSGGPQVIEFDVLTGGSDYAVMVDTAFVSPGITDIGNHGDDVTTMIALPFPVTFYNSTFAGAVVSSNGNLQFSSNSGAFSNVCLPASSLNNVIFAHWDDLRTDALGSGIFTRTTGASPNRVFHIEWRTTYFSGGGTANFELRLHESSSSFEVVYGVIGQDAGGATIGCQRDIGSSFTQHSCNTLGSVPFATMLSFSLPGCPDGGGECCEIVCPDNVFESSDPGQCGTVVEYATPETTGSCGPVICTPPSGSFFPLGTTTVTCTTETGQSCTFDVVVDGSSACVVLDFETEDDFSTPLVNGQALSTPPEFGNLVACASSGPNAGAAIFDSTPGGPNDPSQDRDLLVGSGNIVMLQGEANTTQTVPGIFDRPNDDDDGGTLTFVFAAPVTLQSVDIADIDAAPNEASTVTLTDLGGRTRVYSIPPAWTGDLLLAQPGILTLDLTTLAPQPGFGSSATATQQPGFDPDQVVEIEIDLGGSGAIDDLAWCPSGC